LTKGRLVSATKDPEEKPVVTKVAEVEHSDISEFDSLVGSGTPQIRVRANAGCIGLRAGEIATFHRDAPEVEANLANGNLSLAID